MSGARADRRALLLGATAALAAANVAPAAPAKARLRRGINTFPWFALTREYPAPRIDYPSPPFQPDRPVPSAADLATLRQAGFDFVRISIDAGPLLAASTREGNRLLDDLDKAVRTAQAVGLATLVNLAVNTATHHYTNARLLGGRATPGFVAYRTLVGRMAARLATFDPARTLFEPVNEPQQTCTDALWPALQIDLLETARGAARDLPLVATGACGSMPNGLAALDPGPLRRFAPLLYTFHFYEPYVFSHQGAPWLAETEPMYGVLTDVPWPASRGTRATTRAAVRRRAATQAATAETLRAAERAVDDYFDGMPGPDYLATFFDEVARWAARYGVAPGDVILGEFGALRSDARYVAARDADRARYIHDVRESAERHGFPWAFWNLFDGMGMMDETTRRLDPNLVAALGLGA